MSEIHYEMWEPVIGLEIHAQLNTKTKLFGRTLNRFGDEPNINIDEVDTGQPGALPVLNKEAVKKAVQLGLALNAQVARFSTFDRKSYFYPDSPRNFQITQFYNPIIVGGTVICDVDGQTKHFAIDRAHLEDDSGMLKHFTSFAGVDFNRAGVPLIEIVSKPMMHGPKDAVAYATSLRAILQYLDVANCNMEEGGMRMDVNVSVRPRGDKTLRPKVEIKNMNSFHNMELAIEAEIRRQIQAYSLHPHMGFVEAIQPGTYRFDLNAKKTILMRQKQAALDYRYFHEPDLVPVVLSEATIDEIRKTLPELPHQRYLRYVSELKIAPDSAAILINDKYTSDFFEEALPIAGNPSSLCNWLIVEFAGRLKEKAISLKDSGLQSAHIGNLVKMIETKVITGKIAKLVADEMVASPGKDSTLIVKENPNYLPEQDSAVIEPIVDRILAENPQSIADYKQGRTKALAFLVGQVMKETKGKASPDVVNALIMKKI
ncbi:MAG: Asp-tRNA(Asn)/Glu-tRNA(Gln) amidotransferase subunit GatB [Verrucomicrobia bacterium]|nr:Asp-tRNA(Asn)/Glu-tRNA(Gln) amidotransferase subunit GatB [Verrucomicrobiota bacterium]